MLQLFTDLDPYRANALIDFVFSRKWAMSNRTKTFQYSDEVFALGRPIRFCPVCDTPFEAYGSGFHQNKRYCSRVCASTATINHDAMAKARAERWKDKPKRAEETPEQRVQRMRDEIAKLEQRVAKETPHLG